MFDKSAIEQAKEYIKEMANGINPLTGEVVLDNDLINDVKISRCLFFVSEVLDEYCDLLEKAMKKVKRSSRIKKSNFYATYEDLADFNYSSGPMYLSDIIKEINQCFQKENMKKITFKALSNWLVINGYLTLSVREDGKNEKLPTPLGEELGIKAIQKHYNNRKYHLCLYDINAQRFIIENIEEISKTI